MAATHELTHLAGGPALAVAARICGMTNGLLRLVHVRTSDPPLRSPAWFYRETPRRGRGRPRGGTADRLGLRATTAIVDARRGDVALAIAWQASTWPADLIVVIRHPRTAITRVVLGSVPDQVMRTASCPVLAIPPQATRPRVPLHLIYATVSRRRSS